VNGLAAMQIHNLNAWVEVVRAKVLEEYQPREQGIDVLLSDAVLLRERDYFTSRVHRTWTSSWRTFGRPTGVAARAARSIL